MCTNATVSDSKIRTKNNPKNITESQRQTYECTFTACRDRATMFWIGLIVALDELNINVRKQL